MVHFGAGFQAIMKAAAAATEGSILLSPRTRFRAAMMLAIAADALQISVFPLFVARQRRA